MRSTGGYVVAAPSTHNSGRPYEWVYAPDSMAVADAPGWLIDFMTASSPGVTVRPSDLANGDPYDLQTHPGVSEGGRHDMATRLIGAELGRGTDPLEVLDLAFGWAERCNPPMDRQEVKRIVTDFAAKDAAKLALDVPSDPQLVRPVMGEEAFHGLIGEIVRHVEPQTEADPVAILVQMLIFLGNEVGRTPCSLVGATEHRLNMYAVIAGESSKGRKGTSADIAKALFGSALEQRIASGLSSGEGVICRVTDAVYKPAKGRGKDGSSPTFQEIDIPEAADKRLIVIEPEFGMTLQVLRREGNNLSAVLRNAWDGKTLETLTKVARRATNAHVSLIGHITKTELQRLLLDNDVFNGFANRILWVVSKRARLLPDGGQLPPLDNYRRRIAEVIEKAKGYTTITRDDAAARLWAEVYNGELAVEHPGVLGAVTARGEAQVLRLSGAYAVADGSAVVRVEHLRAALAVWRYCFQSAKSIFGDSTGNAVEDKLWAAIRERPRNKTDLHRLLGNHASAATIEAALGRLIQAGRVTKATVPTGGRQALVYQPALAV